MVTVQYKKIVPEEINIVQDKNFLLVKKKIIGQKKNYSSIKKILLQNLCQKKIVFQNKKIFRNNFCQ